ncbi:MAG: hypothetical protein PSX80_10335, partial [bacterium]|nr:hypothetical protein [bacterium]
MDRNQLKAIAGSVPGKLDVKPLLTCGLLHLTVLLSVGLFAMEVDAQTSRRKPKATPTPVRTTEPAIISRADDFPTVVIEPAPV